MEIVVLGSARKHGVSDEQIRHVLTHTIAIHDTHTDLLMAIGPDPSGALIEVGYIDTAEAVVVVHAMHARPKYL